MRSDLATLSEAWSRKHRIASGIVFGKNKLLAASRAGAHEEGAAKQAEIPSHKIRRYLKSNQDLIEQIFHH